MKKKSVRLLIGVLALCCLIGVYFGLRMYNAGKQKEEEKAQAGEEILNVDPDGLAEISFLIEGEPVSFRKGEDDSWEKEDDDSFPVSASTLLMPLSYLEPLDSLRTLTEVEDASEYGFEDPQNVITLVNKDGEETCITIGDTNEITGNDYLILNGDSSTVYTVSTSLRTAFSDDLYDYAEGEELPEVLASMITGIALKRDTDSYAIYLDDAVWMVLGEDGSARRADSEKVNSLCDELSLLSYTRFVEHNLSDFSAYGLDEPAVEFTLTYTEENGEEESGESETEAAAESGELCFAIGQTDENGDYYTRLGDSSEVHTLSASLVDSLLSLNAKELAASSGEETEEVTD